MIKNIIASLFLYAAVFAASIPSSAQNTGGGEAMVFSEIERSPVSAGMGFSGLASISDLSWAALKNSAGLPLFSKKADIKAIYQNWSPSGVHTTDFGAGAAFKLSNKIGLSLGGIMRMGQTYDLVNEIGVSKGSFTPKDIQLGLGLGYAITPFLSIGLNAKMLNSSLSVSDKYSAVAGDLIAMGAFGNLKVAAGVSDLGFSVRSHEGKSFSIASSAVAGADYSIVLGEKHNIEASFDANYFFSGGLSTALGFQYGFNDMVFIRGGYHFGSSKSPLPSFATAGLGFRFFGLSLDAAYILGNEFLKNTLTIGLGYSF